MLGLWILATSLKSVATQPSGTALTGGTKGKVDA